MNQNNHRSKESYSSQRPNEASVRSLRAQDQHKQDYEIASELDKRQKAYEPSASQHASNSKAQSMTQEQWNARQKHDLEIANDLGVKYAANVTKIRDNRANQPTTQQLMSRNYDRLRSESQKSQDVEFSIDLPNANRSMKHQAMPNNDTRNQFNRNDQGNYSNVDPETDSNRFEKGNN